MSRPNRYLEIACKCCGRLGIHSGRGLRKSCHKWHTAAGTLDQFPRLHHTLPRQWRMEDYAELRGLGLSRRQAAAELGVTVRTAERYDARLKASQEVAA